MAEASERTFIMVKPDGVQRGLIADIIKRFEQKGFKLVAMKFMKVCVAVKLSARGTLYHVIHSLQRIYCANITTN